MIIGGLLSAGWQPMHTLTTLTEEQAILKQILTRMEYLINGYPAGSSVRGHLEEAQEFIEKALAELSKNE